ncbi:Gfo/Idh/MocA family oxidoreductase [Flavobacteriaceae bacterium TP-CH-4]|uniref:Gfo/Idh/MocA family oxidoreductase n=1 Tax=Pelagihabitans pacificus TaxID=2696054 RepID=A0A967EA87_9FLAO|nr:Gfo/Idh/MocA family oxidoreductase [Pelagihabitans pacificus]NHF59191.1 Gfo/Idh/MocA family oxidoreductase [Pelagihabitans pacificus]
MGTQRRKFMIRTGMLAATAAIAPGILLSSKRHLNKKLGVALVGLGYYSTDVLAPALQLTQNCELRGIVTGSPDKIPVWQQKYGIKDGNVYDYQNFGTIANNPDIDVVYVVLPPSMHAEYTIRAARAGKHVWCEKPMAPSVADCEAMIKECANNKVKLAIGYRCQHDPNIQAYMKVAREKPFGPVKMIASAAGYFDGRSDHWKQKKNMGGGVMGDMGVYALQGARLATGEEPISVSAQASTTRPEIYHEVEETMLFQLEFPSGALAACHTSFGIRMNYLQVNYDRGWLKMEPHSSYGGNKGSMSDGTIINFPLKSQQAKQMDEDAAAIMNKTPLLVPGEEGLRDIRVVEAIYKSAAQNCTVKI